MEKEKRMARSKGLVSVCIPTYNGEQYLKQTLDSVVNQTYKNIEIIITDDLSADDTEKIIKSYHDERIKYFVNTKRSGLAGNWNESLKKSSGEFIKILCQDDLLMPDAIEKQVNALNSSDAACVIGNTTVINSKGETIFVRKYFKKSRIIDGMKYAKKSLLGRNIYSEPGNIMYRAECYEKYGTYDSELKYTPDWDFALRISVNGKICCISDTVFSFRVSESSETSRLYREQMKELIKDTDKLIDKNTADGTLKISVLRKLVFKFNIRVFAVLRGIVLLLSKRHS